MIPVCMYFTDECGHWRWVVFAEERAPHSDYDFWIYSSPSQAKVRAFCKNHELIVDRIVKQRPYGD